MLLLKLLAELSGEIIVSFVIVPIILCVGVSKKKKTKRGGAGVRAGARKKHILGVLLKFYTTHTQNAFSGGRVFYNGMTAQAAILKGLDAGTYKPFLVALTTAREGAFKTK